MSVENNVTLIGNLTADPEVRHTTTGAVLASFRLAVNRRYRNRTTGEWEDQLDGFFTVQAWRDLALNAIRSLSKGARVLVVGRLTSRSYEGQDGQTRWVTEIQAEEICPSLRWATATLTRTTRTSAPRTAPTPDPDREPEEASGEQPAAALVGSEADSDVPF